jgi:hypothetical protein
MKSALSASMKTYAYCIDDSPTLIEFFKLWVKSKKRNEVLRNPEVKFITGRTGYVGSGEWQYEYKGIKIAVEGHANGKGFWGTNYSIYEVK